MEKTALEWLSEVGAGFDDLYARSPNLKERFKIWKDLIRRYSSNEYRAVDLGCGTGVFTFLLAEFNREVEGFDGSEEMIAVCNKKLSVSGVKNIRFNVLDLNTMFASDIGELADLVISSSVLEYLYDLDTVLKEIVASIRYRGTLVVSVPNQYSLLRRLEPLSYLLFKKPAYAAYVKHKFTLSQLTECFRAHGLEMMEFQYYSTSFLSSIFRPLGLSRLSEGLIVVVARKRTTDRK